MLNLLTLIFCFGWVLPMLLCNLIFYISFIHDWKIDQDAKVEGVKKRWIDLNIQDFKQWIGEGPESIYMCSYLPVFNIPFACMLFMTLFRFWKGEK